MQQQNLELNNAIGILEKTHTFLIQFKETGFSTSLAAAKDLAEELEMSPDEMVIAAEGSIRRKQRRKQFSYEGDRWRVNTGSYRQLPHYIFSCSDGPSYYVV